MITRIVILLLMLFFAANLSAQNRAPAIKWQKCYGSAGSEDFQGGFIHYILGYTKPFFPDRDGGFIMGGQVNGNSGFVSGLHGDRDIVIAKIDSARNVVWAVCLGGSKEDLLFSIQPDHDGGYLVGATTNSTNGNVTNNHGDNDVWIIKLNRNGGVVWQKCYGGTNFEAGAQIAFVNDGYVFAASTYSTDGDVTGKKNQNFQSDVWVVKIDFSGNIIWQKCIGGNVDDFEGTIKKTTDGGFILLNYTSSTDGDAAVIPPATSYGVDLWFVKLNAEGQIVWQNRWNNGLLDIPQDIEETPDGSFIAVALTEVPETNKNNLDGAIIKLGPTGNVLWSKVMGGSSYETFTDITIAPDNSYMVTGYTNSSDGDIIRNNGDFDVWVLNFDQQGNLIWHRTFGGTGRDLAVSITRTISNNYLIFGFTASNNFDVSGHHGNGDFWLFEIGDYSTITGRVFFDLNRNGIKDPGEIHTDDVRITAEKNGTTYSAIPHDGLYTIYTDTGNYNVKAIPNTNRLIAVPGSSQANFPAYFESDTIDFAIQLEPGHFDLSINISNLSPARPGFVARYKIIYKNIGTEEIGAGTVMMINDPRMTFFQATPARSSYSGDTTRWNFANLLPGQSASIEVDFVINAIRTSPGDILELHSTILPITNDETPANNESHLNHIVTGSYDPNDKSEAHSGIISPTEIVGGGYLTYLVRFQNVGNDTAFNIVVRDTLDTKLDWSSIQMVSSSHNYSIQIKDGNKVTWTFANIQLPDSNINEPASNGYLLFKIRPKANASIGDVIQNSASIYFDFNLPVITNISITEVKLPRPHDPLTTTLQPGYCSIAGIQKVKIFNLPATGSGVIVVVKMDGNILPVAADSTFTFNVASLSDGPHNVVVEFINSTATRVKSSAFNVTAAVNPNVDLTANFTNITSLVIPVVVTAMNTSGGGTAPLYTFARDKNFTQIVQPESADNRYTLDPATLAIGDNKIFVRMKTSATCHVVNIAIDSILLVRNAVTGLIDPDMPGQVINIYPNPFKEAITVTGLSISKTYVIRLLNVEGKQLEVRNVSGRSSSIINRQHHATGIYWLTIFDATRGKLLGSVKLLKE